MALELHLCRRSHAYSDDEAEFTRHFESMTRAPVTMEFERVERIGRAPPESS
jgi:hypothetical protein